MSRDYEKLNEDIFKNHPLMKLLDEKQYSRELTIDGPIGAGYNSVQKRILWVLREPHGEGEGSLIKDVNKDLLERSKPHWNKWYSTWGLIIKVSDAISRGKKKLSASHPSNLKECLSQISVINLNKFGGGSTKSKHYWEGAMLCQPLVKEQVKILNPEIIIFAGTGHDVISLDIINLMDTPFLPSPSCFPVVCTNNQINISAYHTGQRTITHARYCELIISQL